MAAITYNPTPADGGIRCTSSDSYRNIAYPHFHIEYELSLILSGVHHVQFNNCEYTLHAGDVLLIRPNEVHFRSLKTPTGEHIMLVFPALEINRLNRYIGNARLTRALFQAYPPVARLDAAEMNLQSRRISRINLFIGTNPSQALTELRALLVDICFHYLVSRDNASSMYTPWFAKLLQEMERPENIRRGIPAMLELVPYSHEYLCREFKRMMGCTPTEYINSARLNLAHNMLEDSKLGIVDICYAVGFESVSYFYRLYKNKYGQPPSRDRKIRFVSRPQMPVEQRSDLSE